MSQALIQLFNTLLRNSVHELYDRETWALSETISFLALYKMANHEGGDLLIPLYYTKYFNDYYVLFREAILSGRLKYVEEGKSPSFGKIAKFVSKDIDTVVRVVVRILGKDYPLIDQNELTKYLVIREVIQYLFEKGIQLPGAFLEIAGIEDDSYSLELHESEAKDFSNLISKLRSDAGKKKYHRVREFCEDHIENIGVRELESGCRCLHKDMVKRIKSEVEDHAKNCLKGKDFDNFMAHIDENIRDTIITLFYRLDDEYDNVKSRVVRGKFYLEYH